MKKTQKKTIENLENMFTGVKWVDYISGKITSASLDLFILGSLALQCVWLFKLQSSNLPLI